MTLVLAVTGAEAIWLLADRRLSARGRPPKDDGRKIMILETTDGLAILGYAGLGATVNGTEPADWMSRVFRGRHPLLEQSLDVLTKSIHEQFPQHMDLMPVDHRRHFVLAPAFVDGEPRLYGISLVFAPDQKSYRFQYGRITFQKTPQSAAKPPRLAATGTGAGYLLQGDQMRDKKQNLLRMVKASDRGNVSPRTVADYLAKLNNDVHLAMADRSVGHRCTVVWRCRRKGIHRGGGRHESYTSTKRDGASSVPLISNGSDMNALAEVLTGPALKMFDEWRAGQLDAKLDAKLDVDKTNALLAALPREPDENLR